EFLGRNQFHHPGLGCGKQHAEFFDLRVEAPGTKLRSDELSVLFAVGRADVVRASRKPLQPLLEILPVQRRIEARFERSFRGRRSAIKTEQRPLAGRSILRSQGNNEREQQSQSGNLTTQINVHAASQKLYRRSNS